MIRDPREAMLARIGSYGRYLVAFYRSAWRLLWDAPAGYRREAHYMRGPGPKWREKNANREVNR